MSTWSDCKHIIGCISTNKRSNYCCFRFAGAFRLYDVDNDGYITRKEMYDIVDAIYQMVLSSLTTKWLMGRGFFSPFRRQNVLRISFFFQGQQTGQRRREHAAETSREDFRPNGQKPRRQTHSGRVQRGQQSWPQDRPSSLRLEPDPNATLASWWGPPNTTSEKKWNIIKWPLSFLPKKNILLQKMYKYFLFPEKII